MNNKYFFYLTKKIYKYIIYSLIIKYLLIVISIL